MAVFLGFWGVEFWVVSFDDDYDDDDYGYDDDDDDYGYDDDDDDDYGYDDDDDEEEEEEDEDASSQCDDFAYRMRTIQPVLLASLCLEVWKHLLGHLPSISVWAAS